MISTTNMTEQMKREFQNKQKDNTETIRQIQEDTDFEMQDIISKNTKNMKQVQEMSLKSKAELQLVNNKLQDLQYDIEHLGSIYRDKSL